MLKARRIGVSLATVGLALVVQSCWQDDGDGLTLLGNGGCRTADGGEGTPTFLEVSLEACKAKCFEDDAQCTAVEYNANNSNCEIHSEPITKYEEVDNVECYIVE